MDKLQVDGCFKKPSIKKTEACLEHACGFFVHAKLFAFEEKEVYALESQLQILDSKILPLRKALEEVKKYQLAFQKLSANGGFKSDLIISNPTPTHSTRTTKLMPKL